MVNPTIVKEKALSSKGKELSAELEELNWKIQELEFNLDKVRSSYVVKKCKYKEFLGYSLTDEEKKDLKVSEEFLKNECN